MGVAKRYDENLKGREREVRRWRRTRRVLGRAKEREYDRSGGRRRETLPPNGREAVFGA